jgi:hypothetical protein
MPVVILHHLLNVSVQLANKRGLKKSSSNSEHLPHNIKNVRLPECTGVSQGNLSNKVQLVPAAQQRFRTG